MTDQGEAGGSVPPVTRPPFSPPPPFTPPPFPPPYPPDQELPPAFGPDGTSQPTFPPDARSGPKVAPEAESAAALPPDAPPPSLPPAAAAPDNVAADAAPVEVAPAEHAPAQIAPSWGVGPAAIDAAAPPSDGGPTEVGSTAAFAPPAKAAGQSSGRYVGRRRAPKAAKKQKPRRKAPWWELPALVVLAILIAILVKTFVVQPFYIPSESMEKTLHGCRGCHGDRILVNKVIYDFRDPHPGDIVVFNAPPGWEEATNKPPGNPIVKTIRGFGQLIGFVPPDGQVLVKRVIATGGQTVKGDAQGHVMVSNKGPGGPFRTLNEPFTYMPGPATPRAFGAVTVPKGRLWVMGDHRNDSADSRYHCGPDAGDTTDDSSCDPTTSTVPIDDVIGKAFVIAWPPSRWRTLGTPSTFKSAALAAASDVPAFVSGAVLLPVFAVRRRRRRR